MQALPDLLSLSPKMASRAWMKWLGDVYPFKGMDVWAVSNIGLAIGEWELNAGKAAEEVSRKNLAERVATFKAAI